MKTEEYFEYWLKVRIYPYLKPNTCSVYSNCVKNHILRDLGGMELEKLDALVLQEQIANLKCRGLSARTVKLVFTVLKLALDNAVDFNYISQNPCHKTRLPASYEIEADALSRAEQQVIEAAALKSPDKRYLGIIICLYLGLRLGELCALTWQNINFETGQLVVATSLTRIKNVVGGGEKTRMLIDMPKTPKSRRTIPVPDFLLELLRKRRHTAVSCYVICSRRGGYVQPRTMQNIFKGLLKRQGIKPYNFHILRHTFASRCLELGSDIKTLSEILGHSSTVITLNRYAHSLVQQKIILMNTLNSFFVPAGGVKS